MELEAKDTRAETLKQAIAHLPYVCADLPGIGGAIKAAPEHFQVEEILPYAACGEGEHLFVTLRRKLWNTADVAAELARCFELKSMDVGWGGRKDKQAVTTQTFSLLLPMSMPIEEVATRLGALPFEILDLKRHRNKIKTGHVAANRFRILLTEVPSAALAPAQAMAEALRQRGLPNFYGEQRFGFNMANIERAFQLLQRRRPVRGKQDELLVSALQSGLFNLWLAERMAQGEYRTLRQGDVVQKTDTGGLFVVQDLAEAATRFAQGAIAYTGPIFGPKMMAAADSAGEHEAAVLAAYTLTNDDFKRLKAPGSRRRAILAMEDLSVQPDEQGLLFTFSLPPGAYATNVLREFMRPPNPQQTGIRSDL
ncbi:MAG: tRNA pseudouridine(13) synthase TruD [Desulfatitalea sp.]|nr:tRNA pseudouridine(13) synthase TruD [Desulfatitalea sp.]MBI5896666.1 tRNA pseudouridine(13) synthase TruD [Desulfobacterales bacterium]